MDLPIYLDHSATTPVAPDVLAAMAPFFAQVYANPASLYTLGQQAREGVEEARETVAAAIGASPEEVVFTSGGTEADVTAVRTAAAHGTRRRVVVSAVEHHAVLDTAVGLRDAGIEVALAPVTHEGIVDLDRLQDLLAGGADLVSVMHANNEVGAIQPVEEIGRLCRQTGTPFHVDAVQTCGKLPIDVRAIGCDLLSLSAHKLYGPKGVGALYVRRGARLAPLLTGGGQEKGRRAGTLNVPGIVGLGAAAARAVAGMDAESTRLGALRDRLMGRIARDVDGAAITGTREHRLAGNVHCCIDGVEGEPVLLALDAAGVCASSGAACTAGSVEPSHVLLAMGIPTGTARGALRLTLGESTTEEGVDYAADCLAAAVSDLRRMGS